MSAIQYGIYYEAQILSVAADIVEFKKVAPLEPDVISPDQGPPSTVLQWHVKLAKRLVSLEIEARSANQRESFVLLQTPYIAAKGARYDWLVLEDLADLPACINVWNVRFVSSRVDSPSHVVRRVEKNGVGIQVYAAGSYAEASELVDRLKQVHADEPLYRVEQPNDGSYWAIVNYATTPAAILGAYPDKASAVATAISLSKSMGPTVVLCIQSFQGTSSEPTLRVNQGKLI